MCLSEKIYQKHGLKPFFVCNILLAMQRIKKAKKDFDIEHWEKYLNELSEEEMIKKIEAFEQLISKPEGEEVLLKKLEEKENNAERQFSKLAESIKHGTIPHKHVARFAKQKDITWETFLSILKEENPELDPETFTQDCKQYLAKEADPLFEKLLINESF